MAVFENYKYTGFSNLNAKDGVYRFGSTLSSAMDSDQSNTKAIYVRGANLYFWNGTTETAIGAAGSGGLSSWDELYDHDKTLTLDQDTLTFALTHATNDGLTITGSSGSAGDCLKITNSGAGKDISGTSDTWSFTATGILDCTGITIGDDETITFGDDSDVTLEYDENGNNELLLTGAFGINGSIILRGTSTFIQGGSADGVVHTISAGDAIMSDGSLYITDADNSITFRVYNNTATTIGVSSDVGVVDIHAGSLTTGVALNIGCDENALAGGFYLRCWDSLSGAAEFTVGEYGAIVIAGNGGNTVLTLTAGDVLMSDGSVTITDGDNATTLSITNQGITSGTLIDINSSVTTGSTIDIIADILTTGNALYIHDHTSSFVVGADSSVVITGSLSTTESLRVSGIPVSVDMVTFDNTSGAIASGFAVLTLDAGGAVASGGSILRMVSNKTAVQGSRFVTIVGADSSMQAMNIDTDCVDNSAVLINGGGALAATKATLEVTADGTPAASTSSVARFAFTGTETNDPSILNLYGTGKDVAGIILDTDNTDLNAVGITGSGNLTDTGSMLSIDNDGTPATSLVKLRFTGTDTWTPAILDIQSSNDCGALSIVADHAAQVAIPLSVACDNAGGSIQNIELIQDASKVGFMKFTGTAGSGAKDHITKNDQTSGKTAHYILVDVNGSAGWIEVYLDQVASG